MTDSKPIIMAIDDDSIILNSVTSTLKADYSVRPFISGETALKYLSAHSADLILLDYQMPGLTGFDVLLELQASERTADIPVIFLTGAISGEIEAEVLEQGAVDYILKPIKPSSLMIRVRLQLELQNHRKHLEALVAEKTRHLNEAYNKLKTREDITLNLLARVTDMRDHDTGDHIERTTEVVRILVEDLLQGPVPGYKFSLEEAKDIIKSAKLHDLGKIAMPDHILLKRNRLTDEEFKIIMTHPTKGEELLSEFIRQMDDSFLNMARDIAYCHHEKWDGSGYPQGLKGMEIPLAARIVAIADVYDALTSARPYKIAFSHEKSVDIIRDNAGTHFDPYLVSVFERHTKDIITVFETSEHLFKSGKRLA